MFNAQETDACRRLVKLAIDEDLGLDGDLTSRALIAADQLAKAGFISKSVGTVAGVAAASLVFEAVDPRVLFRPVLRDGEKLSEGSVIATVSGSLRSILAAERTALNFMQHLSGIATQTRHYVDRVAGLPCQILDTRKTLPGWRLLEKYAVRAGGGQNHRMALYDGILIKDNHLAGLGIADWGLRLAEAVRRARQAAPDAVVELEIDGLEQLDAVLACGPDIVLLDNMALDDMREAVRRRNDRRLGKRLLLEASGGITLANIRAVGETGVDRISIGALTHSAPALDISLEYQE